MTNGKRRLAAIAAEMATERKVDSVVIVETTGIMPGIHIKTGIAASPYHQIVSGISIIHNAFLALEDMDSENVLELDKHFDSSLLENLREVHKWMGSTGWSRSEQREQDGMILNIKKENK